MDFIAKLTTQLALQSEPERAQKMSDYMRGQYAFYGVMAGPRKQILKETIASCGIPENLIAVSEQLYQLPERELQLCAIELIQRCKRHWQTELLEHLKWLIITKSWWDTVDFIASNLVGPLLKKFPELEPEVHSWADSNDMWLQRVAILYQLKYKDRTDTDWLKKVILQHAHQKEFFIKKAIGWALREYAKTNEKWVREFLANHTLQALSFREASKHL